MALYIKPIWKVRFGMYKVSHLSGYESSLVWVVLNMYHPWYKLSSAQALLGTSWSVPIGIDTNFPGPGYELPWISGVMGAICPSAVPTTAIIYMAFCVTRSSASSSAAMMMTMSGGSSTSIKNDFNYPCHLSMAKRYEIHMYIVPKHYT